MGISDRNTRGCIYRAQRSLSSSFRTAKHSVPRPSFETTTSSQRPTSRLPWFRLCRIVQGAQSPRLFAVLSCQHQQGEDNINNVLASDVVSTASARVIADIAKTSSWDLSTSPPFLGLLWQARQHAKDDRNPRWLGMYPMSLGFMFLILSFSPALSNGQVPSRPGVLSDLINEATSFDLRPQGCPEGHKVVQYHRALCLR